MIIRNLTSLCRESVSDGNRTKTVQMRSVKGTVCSSLILYTIVLFPKESFSQSGKTRYQGKEQSALLDELDKMVYTEGEEGQ